MKKVTKAVIPATGLGTRVLPATKSQPKEMLVIVDKPSLHHPLILKAKFFVGNDPFVIALGDDIMYNPEKEVTKQLIEKYEKYGHSIIGVQEVLPQDISKYGVIKPVDELDSRTVSMSDFVEKPKLEEAPSLKACLGRYLLTPDMFSYLENIEPGKGGNIQLTDGILAMINDNKKVLAYDFEGLRYDIGSKYGLLKANIEFGLRNPETSEDLKEYLKSISTY